MGERRGRVLSHSRHFRGAFGGLPSWLCGEESACQYKRRRRRGLNPCDRKTPWRRTLPTPVLLPGTPHGQRSLVGFSPWGHKGLDTPERLNPDVPGGKKQVPPAPLPAASLAHSLAAVGLAADGEVLTVPRGWVQSPLCPPQCLVSVGRGSALSPQTAWGVCSFGLKWRPVGPVLLPQKRGHVYLLSGRPQRKSEHADLSRADSLRNCIGTRHGCLAAQMTQNNGSAGFQQAVFIILDNVTAVKSQPND